MALAVGSETQAEVEGCHEPEALAGWQALLAHPTLTIRTCTPCTTCG